MLPKVDVGEEGDVVARVPIEGVHDVVKVLGCLVKKVVDGADELQAVLLRGSHSEGEGAREEIVLNVYHKEGRRGRSQDRLDPLLVLCLCKATVSI